MKLQILLLSSVFLFSACGAPAESDISDTPSSVEETVKIVFAADFATGEGCATHKSGGCDLYTAEIDMEGNVTDVQRLTNEADSEVFPVFSIDGETVYANRVADDGHTDIEWVSVEDGSSGILMKDAVGPAPLPDGNSLVYLSNPGFKITLADFLSPSSLDVPQIFEELAGYHEPHSSAEGKVVFYRLFGQGRGSNTAMAAVFDAQTLEAQDLTSKDGTAHCFWNGTGTAIVCNNTDLYHGPFSIPLDSEPGDSYSLLLKHPSVSEISALDEDFGACKHISYTYGNFCDESHLLIGLNCDLEENGVTDTFMSKLALVDFSASPASVVVVGDKLAEAYGGEGVSSFSVDCQ